MASRNQQALAAGRITQAQFDSMAAHKFTCHNNWEDLDVEQDYSKYGIVKWYPVIGFNTKDGREIVSPRGFVKYMMDLVGCDDYDMDEAVRNYCPGDDAICFTYTNLGWTWMRDDVTSIKDNMEQMIYYTFGACFNGVSHPLAQYCCDYQEMYE